VTDVKCSAPIQLLHAVHRVDNKKQSSVSYVSSRVLFGSVLIAMKVLLRAGDREQMLQRKRSQEWYIYVQVP
jgi:hypothetical protein